MFPFSLPTDCRQIAETGPGPSPDPLSERFPAPLPARCLSAPHTSPQRCPRAAPEALCLISKVLTRTRRDQSRSDRPQPERPTDRVEPLCRMLPPSPAVAAGRHCAQSRTLAVSSTCSEPPRTQPLSARRRRRAIGDKLSCTDPDPPFERAYNGSVDAFDDAELLSPLPCICCLLLSFSAPPTSASGLSIRSARTRLSPQDVRPTPCSRPWRQSPPYATLQANRASEQM